MSCSAISSQSGLAWLSHHAVIGAIAASNAASLKWSPQQTCSSASLSCSAVNGAAPCICGICRSNPLAQVRGREGHSYPIQKYVPKVLAALVSAELVKQALPAVPAGAWHVDPHQIANLQLLPDCRVHHQMRKSVPPAR